MSDQPSAEPYIPAHECGDPNTFYCAACAITSAEGVSAPVDTTASRLLRVGGALSPAAPAGREGAIEDLLRDIEQNLADGPNAGGSVPDDGEAFHMTFGEVRRLYAALCERDRRIEELEHENKQVVDAVLLLWDTVVNLTGRKP